MTTVGAAPMDRRFLRIAAVAALGWGTAAFAQTNVGTFQVWSTFVANEPDGKVCFIISQPQDSAYSQPIKGRDPVYFMVTSVPAKEVRNEASTLIGYTFGANVEVVVDIDGEKFKMFTTNGNIAWAVEEQEAALVEAMKRGSKMTVEGKSARGTVTTDSYSLSGVTAALEKVAAECP